MGKGWLRAAPSFLCLRLNTRLWPAAIALVVLALVFPTIVAAQTSRQVLQSLDAKGLGRDVLRVIPNTVFEAGQTPPRETQPFFLRQLTSPSRLLDDPVRQFGHSLRRMAWPVSLNRPVRPSVRSLRVEDVTARFARDIRRPIKEWRNAVAAFRQDEKHDRASLIDTLSMGEIPHEAVIAGLDVALQEAVGSLGNATLRLTNDLIAARAQIPDGPSKDIAIIVGSSGTDVYRPQSSDAITLIVDPAGDDRYDFSEIAAGAVVIVVDHDGADTYAGAGGILSVLVVVDHAGDDRWGGSGPGPAAAFGGIAAIADLAGNDHYTASFFGQAAAVLGRALLYDADGDDRYVLSGLGQGFASTAGAAVLLDAQGDDRYRANGSTDSFDRGGRVSKAQGVGFGSRQGAAGGFGALVDLAGDDIYEAEMFAQGHGFFFGMGLLADRAGNDRYEAVRYVQGTAAHVGIGVLIDDTGDDAYFARVGIAQGMGLDRSFGLLKDGAGDDRYSGGVLAQGASTANGIGVLEDRGGTNRFTLDRNGWGQGHWSGGLPGGGFLLGGKDRDAYVLGGSPQVFQDVPLGGPHARMAMQREGASPPVCVDLGSTRVAFSDLSTALEQAYPLASDGADGVRAHRFVRQALIHDVDAVIAAAADNELRGLGLLGVLRCVVEDHRTLESRAIIRKIENALNRGPMLMGWLYAGALVRLEQPISSARRAIIGLAGQPDCTALVASIELARRTLQRDGGQTPEWVGEIVKRGSQSRCWRAQAAALRFADTQADVRLNDVTRPTFLRDDQVRRKAFSTP